MLITELSRNDQYAISGDQGDPGKDGQHPADFWDSWRDLTDDFDDYPMSDFATKMKSFKPADQFEGSAVSKKMFFVFKWKNTFQMLRNWWSLKGSSFGMGSNRKMAFSIFFRDDLTCSERNSARG